MAPDCLRLSGRHWHPSDVLPVNTITVDLHITNTVGVPDTVSFDALSRLAHHVLQSERASGEWSIGVRFTSDAELQRMHRQFMGIDTPTDIMTFPYGDTDDVFPGMEAHEGGGDLIIAVDRARANAMVAGWSTIDELLFLVVHGILHLLGWDDGHESARTAMLARQHELLRNWDDRESDT